MRSADAIEMTFVGIGMVSLSLGVFMYTKINARRAAQVHVNPEALAYTADDLRAMGDRAPDFLYTL